MDAEEMVRVTGSEPVAVQREAAMGVRSHDGI